MPSINLSTEDIKKEDSRYLTSGFFFSVLLLVVVVCIYFGMVFLNKSTLEKLKLTEQEYSVAYNSFLSGNGNEILDLKNRVSVGEKLMEEDRSAFDILTQIEDSILPSVYLESIDYEKEKKNLTLNFVGKNFDSAAEQLLSLKENSYFSEVSSNRNEFDSEKEGVVFDINLKIK